MCCRIWSLVGDQVGDRVGGEDGEDGNLVGRLGVEVDGFFVLGGYTRRRR